MTDLCPAEGVLVERERARIATQYREAARLRGYMAAVLAQIEEPARATCDIPNHFDLLSAVGEQLTFIGRRMGFPRCHCVCDPRPVLGLSCYGHVDPLPLGGFCDGSAWLGCAGVTDLCLGDDDVYRRHLLVRRYQMLGLFDIESLGACLRTMWGSAAWVVQAKAGQVVLGPGRDLTRAELERLPVTLRPMPIAPGIRIALHFGTAQIAGFGSGWFGFCASVPDQAVFGFDCPDQPSERPITGSCDPDGTWVNCAPPVVSEGYWLCPAVIDPYACP